MKKTDVKNENKTVVIFKNILIFIIILISVTVILAAIFYKKNFAEQSFEALLYNSTYGVEHANPEIIFIGIRENIFKLIVLVAVMYLPLVIKFKKEYKINIKLFGREKSIKVFPFNRTIFVIILIIFTFIFAGIKIGLFDYISAELTKSEIFEEKYVDSANVKLEFPEEKRNLIYIFLESMETSLMAEDEGGGWEYNIIPELTKLAEDNINFSNTEKLGGALQLEGATWTVAGMLAQTAGIPLKMSLERNEYEGYKSFVPGVYTLGDILEREGYNLELMIGSDASFGGRKDYFESHGNYKIFDYNTALEQKRMTEKDKVWWGFSDDDLFKWAKGEILNLAKQDKPFNFMLLTVDTHFVDGYLSEKAEEKYESQYENVFAYSSKSTYEFIKWIQDQKFYDNTTIVVVGDHLGMQTEFYKDHIKNKKYTRTVYNTFINSAVDIEKQKTKNRQFTTLDIFPTVLASMGVKIEGERLGLGTNLFSEKATLTEEMGFKKFSKELCCRSDYYIKNLLQDDYFEMLYATYNEIEDQGGDSN